MKNRPISIQRRAFLADFGLGFTGLAMGAMLHQDGVSRASADSAAPDGRPHHPPKAKSVIWVFLSWKHLIPSRHSTPTRERPSRKHPIPIP